MSTYEIIQHASYGFAFVSWMIAFVFSQQLTYRPFFRICRILASFSLFFGIILELTNVLQIERGGAFLTMSGPAIYLGLYHLFLKLFRAKMGTDPYITSASSRVGDYPLPRTWVKYPKNRLITQADFIFSFAQALIPTFLFLGLMLLVSEMNR